MKYKLAGIAFRRPEKSPWVPALIVGLIISLLAYLLGRGGEVITSWGLSGFALYMLNASTEGSEWRRWLYGVLVCLLSTIVGHVLWFFIIRELIST